MPADGSVSPATALQSDAQTALVASGKLDCFAQNSGKQLLKGFYNGTSWSAWSNLGGDVFAQPRCHVLSTGFDCYWTTSTFHLIRRQRIGTTWQAQVDLSVHNTTATVTVQQRPTCLVRNSGARIDCFARGTNNTLQQRSYY
jgi:hypothetical protein